MYLKLHLEALIFSDDLLLWNSVGEGHNRHFIHFSLEDYFYPLDVILLSLMMLWLTTKLSLMTGEIFFLGGWGNLKNLVVVRTLILNIVMKYSDF